MHRSKTWELKNWGAPEEQDQIGLKDQGPKDIELEKWRDQEPKDCGHDDQKQGPKEHGPKDRQTEDQELRT